MDRLGASLALLIVAASVAAGVEVAPGLTVETVVSGVPRPVQVAMDASRHLVILSHGRQGDAAAELYRLEVSALPVDASREPHVVIPFSSTVSLSTSEMERRRNWPLETVSGQEEETASWASPASLIQSKASNFGITGSLGTTAPG